MSADPHFGIWPPPVCQSDPIVHVHRRWGSDNRFGAIPGRPAETPGPGPLASVGSLLALPMRFPAKRDRIYYGDFCIPVR